MAGLPFSSAMAAKTARTSPGAGKGKNFSNDSGAASGISGGDNGGEVSFALGKTLDKQGSSRHAPDTHELNARMFAHVFIHRYYSPL